METLLIVLLLSLGHFSLAPVVVRWPFRSATKETS